MLIMVDDHRLEIKQNEKIEQKKVRFRTLGCYPLTAAVESSATTVEEIIIELLESKFSERQGRLIDKIGTGKSKPGLNNVSWKANAPSGTYFIQMSANNNNYSQKIQLVK